MRKGTIIKYRAIQARYKELYHRDRKRIDDVYKQLGKEFFVSARWIEEILRMELPDAN